MSEDKNVWDLKNFGKKDEEEGRIFLHNNLNVRTDSFGNWKEESVKVGFVNYGKKGKKYYSYDEVVDMIESGELNSDEFYIDNKTGKYELRSSYLSYCQAFSVYCGRVLGKSYDEDDSILAYCKEIGLVHDDFVPVEGWYGIKTMKENTDGSFNINYQFKERQDNINYEYVEKICVGAVKRLAGKRTKVHNSNGVENRIDFECTCVKFDRETLTLIIAGIPKEYIDSSIHSVINSLDLELWMMCNPNKEWSRFFTATVDMVKDMGQDHWLRDVSDKPSNKDWYDVQLGETLEN